MQVCEKCDRTAGVERRVVTVDRNGHRTWRKGRFCGDCDSRDKQRPKLMRVAKKAAAEQRVSV